MKRIHTFDELRAAANRFKALMRQLYGERGATEKLPQNELTLGLLVIAPRRNQDHRPLARGRGRDADHDPPAHQLQPTVVRGGHVAGGRVGAPTLRDGPIAVRASWRSAAQTSTATIRRVSLSCMGGLT